MMDRKVILVVEDEPLVLMFATDMLEEAGFEVLSAIDAEAALTHLEVRDDIRVMFTDVDMPGDINGIQLAANVRSRWPAINIVITSGKPLAGGWMLPADVPFFSKPYLHHRILTVIEKMAA